MTQRDLFTVPTETVTTTQATFMIDNKSVVKQIWDKFWTNGFSNPMTTIFDFVRKSDLPDLKSQWAELKQKERVEELLG